jgi:MFS family permease
MTGPCAARKRLHKAGILLRIPFPVNYCAKLGCVVSELERPKARWEAPSRAFARFFRLIWGDDVDAALRPVLLVSVCGSVAFSAIWTFVGIWAIKALGASGSELGVAFLAAALGSMFAGYAGGALSDRIGRKPVIMVGFGIEAAFLISLAGVGDRTLLGLGLVAVGSSFGSVGSGASQAMVADLVPPERHERAYAAMRVGNNLGVTIGPPLGGLLLLGGQWSHLFLGAGILLSGVIGLAARFLPRRGAYSPEEPPTRGSFGVIRNDFPFLLFFVSGGLAFLVYIAYETLLPISLVSGHGLAPSTWGFLVIVNPIAVTFFQLRLTRRVERYPAAPRLVLAMLLMGWPFLLLSVSSSIPVVVVLILIFVLGEMLWVPTSQAIVAGLAPPDLRGAYMGAFGSTSAVGFALGPLLGLSVRSAAGDAAMWSTFGLISVVAAITGAVACRFALGRRPVGVPEAA